jgi:formamidopyrimidine-DNA glycosylase
MPELAEVEWFRKQWAAGIGASIVDLSLHPRNRVFRGTSVEALRQKLIGEKLLSSDRRGKRMLFKFSKNNPEIIGARENVRSWLGIHLGMTGKIHLEPANYRPAKHDHLVLFQRDRALVFTDSRQFGRVRFHRGTDEPDWWKSDAAEINSPEFDQKSVDQFLARHRKAPIKAALLMQNGFPGIGNWMADEILWRAKILSSKRIRKLTARERAELFRSTKVVVRRSLETLGKDFSDPPRNWLIHQKWKRDGVCPIHRTPLRHATVAGRTTAWCPKCQN